MGLNSMDSHWFDAVDYHPQIVCEVELPDGAIVDAVFILGNWETLQGKILNPVRFRLKSPRVIMPLFSYKLPGGKSKK